LSRDEVLLLFNGEDGGDKASLGVYSIPLQRIVCHCRFPFVQLPSTGSFLTKPESRFGDKDPFSMAKMMVPDPLLAIIGISFSLGRADPDGCSIILSVDAFRKAYLSLLENQAGRDVFEWEEWGPATTRWLPPSKISPAGIRVICGPRILVRGWASALVDEASNEFGLMILDFNPRPIRQGATQKLEGTYQSLVIDHETEWKDPDSDLKVTSRLPFRAFIGKGYSRANFYRFDGSTVVSRMVCRVTLSTRRLLKQI
jgi:hypothetical protein